MNTQSQPNDTTVATTNFIGKTQCALTAVNTVPGTFNITSCSSVGGFIFRNDGKRTEITDSD